jgi:hypothetical protein
MVWDVMVAAAFVVVSVAVLACFWVKHVLSWLKKPHRRVLPFPGSMILSRHRFREIVRSHSYAWPYIEHVAMRRRAGSLKWSALFRRIWSNHKEDTLISHATIITLIASSAWCIRNQEALANLLSPPSNVINQSELDSRWGVASHTLQSERSAVSVRSRPLPHRLHTSARLAGANIPQRWEAI